jgi:alpha-L-fucosidase
MTARTEVGRVQRHSAPAWWRDAKLGIFVHWTPASVPGFAPVDSEMAELMAKREPHAMAWSPYSEWYENSLRFPESPAAKHHRDVHGNRDYHEFAAEWEAALVSWDPHEWAARFAKSGARYVVLVTKHHDGYCLWPSKVANPHRPSWYCKRDVVGELAEAVRAVGLRFGVYYSGGLDWTFNDYPIGTFTDLLAAQPRGHYPAYAEAQVRELIDRYRPSVLWNDISWPTPAGELARLLADYYRAVPEGVVNDRFMPWSPLWRMATTKPGRQVLDRAVSKAAAADNGIVPPRPPMYDVRTPEYTVFETIQREPWECVRGIDKSFGHNRASREESFLGRDELVWTVVDIAAKGGNLLLNVGPRGEDATIAEAQLRRLDWLAEFTSANAPALYATRPWVRASGKAEGCEIRYTARDQFVYAFVRPQAHRPAVDVVRLGDVDLTAASHVSDIAGTALRVEAGSNGVTVWLKGAATRDSPSVVALESVDARPA